MPCEVLEGGRFGDARNREIETHTDWFGAEGICRPHELRGYLDGCLQPRDTPVQRSVFGRHGDLWGDETDVPGMSCDLAL